MGKIVGFWQILVCVGILGGCKPVVEEKLATDPLNPYSKTSTRIVDLASCNATPKDEGNIYASPWMDIRRAEKNVLITETLIFRSDLITKRTVCSFDNQFVETAVSVSGGVSEKMNEIVIGKSAVSTKDLKFGKLTYTCRSELRATQTPIKYKFAGDCLYLIVDDNNQQSYPPSYW